MTLAYKVVLHSRSGALVSSWAYGDWQCQYTPGKWTEAKPGSGLFVFETLSQALAHAGCASQYEVWECEVAEPMALPSPQLTLYPARFAAYWSKETESKEVFPQNVPLGTRVFGRVKLLRQIPLTV